MSDGFSFSKLQTINDIGLRGYVLQGTGYLPFYTYILSMCNYTQLLILAKALPCSMHGTVPLKRPMHPPPRICSAALLFSWPM